MKNKSLFKNFFEGDLSLAISFWFFGFISLTVIGVVIALIFKSMAVVRILTYPQLIYASIGIWRSSNKYKGSKFFSILAKIFIVLWNLSQFFGLLASLG